MKKILFILLSVFLIVSCKKDNIGPDENPNNNNNTTIVDTVGLSRDTLYYIMKDWYYWYSLMPDVNKDSYSDPYKLMDAMRYKDLDRWSFVADYNEFIAEMQGEFVGHGFRIGVDDAGKARIALIYNNSPLYQQGVRRGWIVKTINGVAIAPILISGDGQAYDNAIGPGKAGITNSFVFTKPDGTDVTISSTKAAFTLNTVLVADTLHLKSGIAGHLVFDQFIIPSRNELSQAFAYFKANNVTDLILDLRYNGGGYLDIAQTLASYIGGNGLAGQTFAKLQYNNKHSNQNTTYAFKSSASSLGLQRLVVITTRSTASASEAVMNGLKPHLNVVSLGDTTNGKPTGMNGWDIAKKYFAWPVTFKIVNSQEQGEYFAGIAPLKILPDDITHDFSDRREANLREAIHYLETGAVSAKSFREIKNYPQFDEKKHHLNNTFVLEK
jgi:C-terminal processing protease CtpA/Prc